MAKSCEICGSRFGNLVCAYCTKSVYSSCLVQDKSTCIKCGRIRKPASKFLRRNFLFIMLFVAFWFFTAGVYPFPYFFAIGKSLDPVIMEPILIATGVMALSPGKNDLHLNDLAMVQGECRFFAFFSYHDILSDGRA